MTILASTALLLLISVSVKSEGDRWAECEDNTFKCSDCGTLVGCFGGIATDLPCAAGQVCGNNGVSEKHDGCFEVSDCSNTKLSQCSCDAWATTPSYIADPYDIAKYLACLPGNAAPQSLSCTDWEIFIEGEIPPCGERPPTTLRPTWVPTTTPAPFECSAAGFNTYAADCNKYWLCAAADDQNPSELTCPAGQVFNIATLKCMDPCDSSAETFSCDGKAGAVADSLNCSIFHICVNGAPISRPIPCPDGKFFNTDTSACDLDWCATDENPCLICSTATEDSTKINGE